MWRFYLRVMTVLLLPWFYFYVSYSSTAFDDGRFVDLSSGAMGQASVENATAYPSWSIAMGSCVNSYPAVTTHAMEQGQRPWSWLEFDKFLCVCLFVCVTHLLAPVLSHVSTKQGNQLGFILACLCQCVLFVMHCSWIVWAAPGLA